MCLFIYSFVYLSICSQEYCVKILTFLHFFVIFFCEYLYLEILDFLKSDCTLTKVKSLISCTSMHSMCFAQ